MSIDRFTNYLYLLIDDVKLMKSVKGLCVLCKELERDLNKLQSRRTLLENEY